MVHRAAAALLLCAVLLAPAATRAQAVPGCAPASEGVAACLAGRECVCRFEPARKAIGRPAGFRWDCGILRPRCPTPERAVPMWDGSLPSSIDLSTSRQDIIIGPTPPSPRPPRPSPPRPPRPFPPGLDPPPFHPDDPPPRPEPPRGDRPVRPDPPGTARGR
jgi:hypothetical protein